MEFYHYYDRAGTRTWWGIWQDKDGNQIGDAVSASTSELVLIELGRVHDDRLALHRESQEN